MWHEKAWGLTELLDYVPDKIKSWKPQPEEVIGLGRNCMVFDQARVYSYAEWRRRKFDDQNRLLAAVFEYSMNINLSFRVPMQEKEVLCIARSISRWTARHISIEGFSEWQRDKNRKSVIVRRAKADSKAEDLKIYYDSHPGITRKELARIFGVSEKTIQRLKLFKDR